MSFINCPKCHKDISDRCMTCVYCKNRLEILDENRIRYLSKNNQGNKSAYAMNSIDILSWLFDYQRKYEEYIRTSKSYDAASALLSDNHWLNSISENSYDGENEIRQKTEIEVGMLLMVDFGKGYEGEMSFNHAALCLLATDKNVLVAPMTTSSKIVNKAYHKTEKPKSSKDVWLGKDEDGFHEKSAILLNDIKFVSYGRVIKTYGFVNSDLLNDIILESINILFPTGIDSIRKIYEQKLDEINHEKIALVKENKDLKRRIKQLDNTVNQYRSKKKSKSN